MSKKNRALPCENCGSMCCRYVATQIDVPTTKRDYDNIRWYLKHKDVFVFKDDEGDWYVEFAASCVELASDGRCGDYENRPRVCRRHGHGKLECEFVSETEPHRRRFSTSAEFERYLDAKGVDWRWKKP